VASAADELAQARRRLDALALRLDRLRNGPAAGSPMVIGTVYDGGSIPSTTPRVFLVHPVSVGGTEDEGEDATFPADAGQGIPVVVLGPSVPVVGDRIRARRVGGRWVAMTCAAGIGLPPVLCVCTPTPPDDVTLSTGAGETPLAGDGATLSWEGYVDFYATVAPGQGTGPTFGTQDRTEGWTDAYVRVVCEGEGIIYAYINFHYETTFTSMSDPRVLLVDAPITVRTIFVPANDYTLFYFPLSLSCDPLVLQYEQDTFPYPWPIPEPFLSNPVLTVTN
jgi:hypothetical protein